MATTLNATVAVKATGVYSKTDAVFGDISAPLNLSGQSAFLNTNTGANPEADVAYQAQASIAASGTLTLDVAGSLLDAFGTTIAMVRVKLLYIELAGASSIVVGNVTNGIATFFGSAADSVRVRKRLLLEGDDATGYAITAGTADLLKIVNEDSVNAAVVSILILGSKT